MTPFRPRFLFRLESVLRPLATPIPGPSIPSVYTQSMFWRFSILSSLVVRCSSIARLRFDEIRRHFFSQISASGAVGFGGFHIE